MRTTAEERADMLTRIDANAYITLNKLPSYISLLHDFVRRLIADLDARDRLLTLDRERLGKAICVAIFPSIPWERIGEWDQKPYLRAADAVLAEAGKQVPIVHQPIQLTEEGAAILEKKLGCELVEPADTEVEAIRERHRRQESEMFNAHKPMVVSQSHYDRGDLLAKLGAVLRENERLKREILATGKDQQFDWSVLERLDRLESAEAERDRLRADLEAEQEKVKKLETERDSPDHADGRRTGG